MPGQELLKKLQTIDKDANGIDLQEFQDGIKNFNEKDYQELSQEIKEKDEEVLKILDGALQKAKSDHLQNIPVDQKILNLLELSTAREKPIMLDDAYIQNIKILL